MSGIRNLTGICQDTHMNRANVDTPPSGPSTSSRSGRYYRRLSQVRRLVVTSAKRRRYAIIDNRKKDEWSGFADLLANLIEKYAAVLDIENLPEPPICLDSEKKEIVNNSKLFEESIEKTDIA